MKQPTVFVSIESHGGPDVVARALKAAIEIGGAESVEQLVQGDVEADIVVTNSVRIALRMVKETERTSIVIMHSERQEREEAEAFASRNPYRVHTAPILGAAEGQMAIVPFLFNLIAEKAKEV